MVLFIQRSMANVLDEERRTRPSLVTDDLTAEVNARIRVNRWFTISGLYEHFPGVFRFLTHEIVTKYLHYKKLYAICWVPNMLTNDHKEKSKRAAVNVLERHYNEGYEFPDYIVTDDETWIAWIKPGIKQQSSHWRHTGSPDPKISNMLRAQKIMGTVFWDREGISCVRFLQSHTVKH
jgi:hypothetical protein